MPGRHPGQVIEKEVRSERFKRHLGHADQVQVALITDDIGDGTDRQNHVHNGNMLIGLVKSDIRGDVGTQRRGACPAFCTQKHNQSSARFLGRGLAAHQAVDGLKQGGHHLGGLNHIFCEPGFQGGADTGRLWITAESDQGGTCGTRILPQTHCQSLASQIGQVGVHNE